MIAQEPQLPFYQRGVQAPYTWSARFVIAPALPLGEIIFGRLGALVTAFDNPEWPISGAVLGAATDTTRDTLILGLDPSRRHGTPSLERCETIAERITETQGWQREPETLPEMRAIVGRRIGYDADDVYSLNEVRSSLIAHGCGQLAVTEADLFSLRYVDGLRVYHEPGVVVEGAAVHLPALLEFAAAIGQERVVPEITGVETQVYQV
ncbi:MAG TPA: hypothetical protein VLF91_03460 [Candidatus Saccharimonadales bacterium]|nr:hypothetical protein [Candidatus Saccharimonadales bacterium]